MKEKRTIFKIFQSVGVSCNGNIPVNKKILVIYYKMHEYIPHCLSSNVILFVSSYGNMSIFFLDY